MVLSIMIRFSYLSRYTNQCYILSLVSLVQASGIRVPIIALHHVIGGEVIPK